MRSLSKGLSLNFRAQLFKRRNAALEKAPESWTPADHAAIAFVGARPKLFEGVAFQVALTTPTPFGASPVKRSNPTSQRERTRAAPGEYGAAALDGDEKTKLAKSALAARDMRTLAEYVRTEAERRAETARAAVADERTRQTRALLDKTVPRAARDSLDGLAAELGQIRDEQEGAAPERAGDL